MKNEIPSKPTTDAKQQLADKTKAMTTGSVVKKGGFSPLVGNDVDHQIGHIPQPKK